MNIVLTINLPGTAQGFTAVADLVRRFGDDSVTVTVEPDRDELADDEVDEEMVLTILRTASQRASHPEARMQLTQLIDALQAPEPAQRQAELHTPSSQPAQGTGQRVVGLETVQCPTCFAAVGEPCKTDSGKVYYPGWGHQARIAQVAPNHRRPGRR